MAGVYKDVSVKDGVKTTVTYTCESKRLKYTIIGDSIKGDFKFLTNEMSTKLDEVLSEVSAAANITDAFYFENGSTVSDLQNVYSELDEDIKLLKSGLAELYQAFMTDIDNVNAELKHNFGYVIFNKPVVAGRKTETISNNNG